MTINPCPWIFATAIVGSFGFQRVAVLAIGLVLKGAIDFLNIISYC